ncbi:MAG TPA: hypothetical protein EYP98_08040 [Planctomycetes bacterium]|nr:hypothetical protein [Planctomycetota bacterium]
MANSDPTPAPARMQRTLKDSVEYKGVGLHSGKEIKITVRPAEAGTGVTFVRTDLDSQPVVRAHGANMKARQRRTCIQDGRAEVYTCEHLLAGGAPLEHVMECICSVVCPRHRQRGHRDRWRRSARPRWFRG